MTYIHIHFPMTTLAKIVGVGFVAWFMYSERQHHKRVNEQRDLLFSECLPLSITDTPEVRQRLIEHNRHYPECAKFRQCNPLLVEQVAREIKFITK